MVQLSLLLSAFTYISLAFAAGSTATTEYPILFKREDTTATATSSSSSSTQPTTVWVTTTDAAGNKATNPVQYTQSFSKFYTSVASPSSGSIGLGTISGTVGDVRSYTQITITATTTQRK